MTTPASIVLVPWYEPEDFYRLRLMCHGRHLPHSYDEWQRQAVAATNDLLSRGVAAQIVRLNIEDYFNWLYDRSEADTAPVRIEYLRQLSEKAGCMIGETCWPLPPGYH